MIEQHGLDGTRRPKLTASALCELYLKENLLRPATEIVYRGVAARFDKFSGNRDVDEIDLALVIEWRDAVLGKASPRSWNTYLAHIRTLWNWGMRRHHITVAASPFREIKRAPVPVKPKKTLAEGLFASVLDYLQEDARAPQPAWFWSIVLRVFYYTAIRKRQLLEMQWGDLDLKHGTLRLRAESSKTRREWTIPLTPEVVRDLGHLRDRTFRAHAERERIVESAREMPVFNLPLFNPDFSGDRLTAYALEGFCRKIRYRFGNSISPHRFRHSTATSLANESGSNLKALQQYLGHTSMQTTLEYVHPDLGQMRDLVERLPAPRTKGYDSKAIACKPRAGRETRGR